MGVKGKLVSQISIKSEQDVFQLFIFPSPMPHISPEKVQSVDLLGGHWGTLGSIVSWNYTEGAHEGARMRCAGGEKKVNKVIIEAADLKKKSITFKTIEGNLLESCNSFKIIVDVRTNGEEHLITWTFEYEKKSEGVPDPRAFMDYLLDFSKQIESNPQLVPN